MRNPAHALPLTIWATPLPQRRGPARPCLAPSDGGKGRAPASTSMAPLERHCRERDKRATHKAPACVDPMSAARC